MTTQVQYILLSDISTAKLYEVFMASFADYAVEIRMSLADYERRLDRIGYLPQMSAAAVLDGRLISFITHGLRTWDGKITAYNGGTGTIPSMRGKGLAKGLYRYLLTHERWQGVERCVLEVLSDNFKAIALYEGLGFRTERILDSYLDWGDRARFAEKAVGIEVCEIDSVPPTLAKATGCQPAWQNSLEAITQDAAEQAFVAKKGGEELGILRMNRLTGRISWIYVDERFRRNRVATSLICYARKHIKQRLSLINVPQDDALAKWLKKNGFDMTLQQREMILDLTVQR